MAPPPEFAPPPAAAPPWHTMAGGDVLAQLGTSDRGLSPGEARLRLAREGPNALPGMKPRSPLRIALSQLASPLIYVLVAADAAVFLLGELADGAIILGIILMNATLGAIQEGRAERTLAALTRLVRTEAEVLRGGERLTVPDTEVVPGDLILLHEGGKVPADARLIEAHGLQANESTLTGESVPVRKDPAPLTDPHPQTAELRNMVFRGTTISTGYGTAVAVATGSRTVVGSIGAGITRVDTEIPLTRDLRALARLVVLLVGILALALFSLGVAEGKPPREMLVAGVAIAVAAVPEGLPLVLTVILAVGVSRMAKRRVLVRKLPAVEALGQATVIAVDKTGTITKNELTVRRVLMAGRAYDVPGVGYAPEPRLPNPDANLLLAARLSALCSNAHVSHDTAGGYHVVGDPTEAAMKVFAEKAGVERAALLRAMPLIADWPFDYAKKYHAALADEGGSPLLAVTGAPEVILGLSARALLHGREEPLGETERRALMEEFLARSREGNRVIAFAFIRGAPRDIDQAHLPPLTFGGLLAMQDPLREGIRAEVARAQAAGIRVVMITGDHAATAEAIAQEAGILVAGGEVISGAELDGLDTATLAARLDRIAAYARVTPEHKVRIIEAFRARGEVIAMTGDGVNDAPSLVAADLGIAMGRGGTEVAREAADLVLLDDNFGDILAAVEEGRNLRGAIRRSISYLFSSNLGEILLIAAALAWGLPLPLLAAQIIWMNLVTDTFFDVALAMEPRDPALMAPRAGRPRKLVDRAVGIRLLTAAPVMAAGALALFLIHLSDLNRARTVALTALVVFQWLHAWNCRSETRSVFTLRPFGNRFLTATLLLVIVLQALALFAPPLRAILGTVPLGLGDVLPLIGIAFSVLIADEARKFFARRAAAQPATSS